VQAYWLLHNPPALAPFADELLAAAPSLLFGVPLPPLAPFSEAE
jgi:hypothetical protein